MPIKPFLRILSEDCGREIMKLTCHHLETLCEQCPHPSSHSRSYLEKPKRRGKQDRVRGMGIEGDSEEGRRERAWSVVGVLNNCTFYSLHFTNIWDYSFPYS